MSTGHNWILSTGMVAVGTNDLTHIQLPSSDPCYNGSGSCNYVGAIAMVPALNQNIDYSRNAFCRIVAHSSVGVLTCASAISQASVTGSVASGTYTGGLSCPGATAGQLVALGDNDSASYVYLTSSSSPWIASGTALTIQNEGSGYGSAPTSTSYQQYYSSATCTGTATIATTLGVPYTVYDSITISNTASAASAVVTFNKTASLSGTINVGDGILGYNGWGGFFPLGSQSSYVSAVGPGSACGTTLTAKQLCVINNTSVTASSTPSMAWRETKWTAGDVGRLWVSKHSGSASAGAQSAVYPPQTTVTMGGSLSAPLISDTYLNGGGSGPADWPALEMAAAQYDIRANRDLTRLSTFMWDQGLRPGEDYFTGKGRDGPQYTTDATTPNADLALWSLRLSVPGFPNMHVADWGVPVGLWRVFSTLPDLQGGTPREISWAAAYGQGFYGNGDASLGVAFNSAVTFSPLSGAACYLRNWAENVSPNGSLWPFTEASVGWKSFLHNDPRVCDTAYNGPFQYAFITSGSSTVAADTGWPHLYRGQDHPAP